MNPVGIKEEIWDTVQARAGSFKPGYPLEIVRVTGDPMMAAAAGIVSGCNGNVLLAGGNPDACRCSAIKGNG